MGLVQNFQKAFTSMFASYVEVTNSTGIDTNPIVKTLENMNTRPNFKTNEGVEYLAFGKYYKHFFNMIDIILKLLEITESKDEKIQILKGKYNLETTWKGAIKQYKMERQ